MSEPSHPAAARGLSRMALVSALSLLSAVTLVACQPGVAPAQAAAAAAAPPAVPVALAQTLALTQGLSQIGRVQAAQRVELQPRVAGHIEALLFKEGELVQAGQPLIQIDPRPFDAAVARARAELRVARARESLAAAEAERARQLVADAALAREELERRVAAQAEGQARSAAAEAELQKAQLEREFTLIRSPIAGRIGRALVTKGNYVGVGGSGGPLATIVSVAPLHVHFDLADRALLERLQSQRSSTRWQARILDAEGQRELARAPVDFADNEVLANTGTLRLRARVDAPHAALLPGQFVRVELLGATPAQALMVPDQAIGTDQGHRYVLVVPPDGKLEYRQVQVGAAQGGLRVVRAGLKEGEAVVAAGLMRVRPGMTVTAQPVAATAATAAPQS